MEVERKLHINWEHWVHQSEIRNRSLGGGEHATVDGLYKYK